MSFRSTIPSDFRAGIRASAPLLLGIVPFALVAGIGATSAGMSVVQALGLSLFVFAGASQLAAIDLIGSNASLLVVVATAVIINLRMLMYSASIAPYFQSFRLRSKGILAYFLTDQVYALSVAEYAQNDDRSRRWFYLGIGVALWVVWQFGTVVGAVIGSGIPESWGLDFAVPLVFLALLVPALKDRATTTAGVVAGIAAVVAATVGVPLNFDLPIAAVVGIVTGLLVEAREDR
ncbi:AzlC family ABC transporter permease [Haloferacaceae archaeon DSL9]